MSEILFSICIPTYNRNDFLDYLLEGAARTWNFDFAYEIVISDNASSDQTTEVVEKHRRAGLPIRYHRQTENKGSAANLTTAFRLARGRYILYLADDDLIIPEAVVEALNFLRANPDLRALYAPWEIYDDIAQCATGTFYEIENDKIFNPGDEDKLFNLLTHHHIFPEIMIYRADAVHSILAWPRFCFWAFALLADTVLQGPIAFRQRPFYRSVTRSSVRPARSQAGVDQAMTDWDAYRGGLEYFVHSLSNRRRLALTPDNRRAAQEMIDGFVAQRMRVALRLWLGRGDYLNAYDLLCRLSYRDVRLLAGIEGIEALPVMAAAQKLGRFANAVGGVERVQLIGFEDGSGLVRILRQVGLEDRIAAESSDVPPWVGNPHTVIALIAQETDRETCIQLGFNPNLVISGSELVSGCCVDPDTMRDIAKSAHEFPSGRGRVPANRASAVWAQSTDCDPVE